MTLLVQQLSWLLKLPNASRTAFTFLSFKGEFDWPYSGIRISGIGVKFFFGVKCSTISQQKFVGKRCCKSCLDSDNIKILVNVIFRRKPSHSYSGIRPIERTLNLKSWIQPKTTLLLLLLLQQLPLILMLIIIIIIIITIIIIRH